MFDEIVLLTYKHLLITTTHMIFYKSQISFALIVGITFLKFQNVVHIWTAGLSKWTINTKTNIESSRALREGEDVIVVRRVGYDI